MTTTLVSPNSEHDGETFSNRDFSDLDLTGTTFENCKFFRCTLTRAILAKTRFISCKFESCDLSNAILKSSRMRDTEFEGCKLLGIQWTQLDDFINPSFDSCNLNYSNFVGLKLKKTHFFKCSLREADFSQADLTECSFKDSDLSLARFNATTLMKADFRGALNYVIDPILNKVKGAKFSLPEAQGLLVGLGIIIE